MVFNACFFGKLIEVVIIGCYLDTAYGVSEGAFFEIAYWIKAITWDFLGEVGVRYFCDAALFIPSMSEGAGLAYKRANKRTPLQIKLFIMVLETFPGDCSKIGVIVSIRYQ